MPFLPPEEVITGKTSQRKGRTAEISLSKILNEYGLHTRPGSPLNYGTESDIVGLEQIHCEVKRTEKLRLYDFLEQAKRDSERFCDGLPTLFYKANRKPWTVIMELEDWLQIYLIYLKGLEK